MGADPAVAAAAARRWVLAFFPGYLITDDETEQREHDAWDLQDEASWERNVPHGGGPPSTDGARDDDPARLAAWVGEQLGYPVELVADETRIGWPPAKPGETQRWNTEPVYRVRPTDLALAARVEAAR